MKAHTDLLLGHLGLREGMFSREQLFDCLLL